MTGFKDVVDLLDGLVVGREVRKHGPFWRGKTRDDFLALSVFGNQVVVVGDPGQSNLVLALKGFVPFGADEPSAPDDAVFSRMPSGGPVAAPEVIASIEAWITAGCPEHGAAAAVADVVLDEAVSDTDHVSYWRAFDDFFLYRATDEVSTKVGEFMSTMTGPWKRLARGTITEAAWDAVRTRLNMKAATELIRDNHDRIMKEHYGDPLEAEAILESHWKFGGDLLPSDPQSSGDQQHTMNGPSDWANWAPFIDTVLRDDPGDPFSLVVARAWHVGIVADGSLRASPQRRINIPDFDRNDEELKEKVIAHYKGLDGPALRSAMATRMLQSGIM